MSEPTALPRVYTNNPEYNIAHDPLMYPLLEKLSKRRGDLNFKVLQKNPNIISNIIIYANKHELGVVYSESIWSNSTHSHTRVYRIDIKGHVYGKRTKHMSNALSLIEEHCRAPTNEEICREVKESATLMLARWISDLQREHTFAYSAVTQKANLILNLPEDRKMNEVYDILGRKAVEAARKASLELARARDTEAALDATGAIIIQTTENEYVVNPKDTENVEIYTNETLPVKYRANLGTLKILSDEKVQNVINDVGVIIEKDQYYVIPKE